MRSTNCHIRGIVGLSPTRSSEILGVAEVVDCIELSVADGKNQYFNKHCVDSATWLNTNFRNYRYAWVLSNVKKLKSPISYLKKSGPIIWMPIGDDAAIELEEAIKLL